MIHSVMIEPKPRRHSFAASRRIVAVITAAALAFASAATPARAASSDDDEVLPDARLTGYEGKVDLGGGVALSYALAAVLGAIAIGVTFKNARRTHLD